MKTSFFLPKTLFVASVLLTMTVLFSSCSQKGEQKVSATGRNGELLVVMPQAKWESEMGAATKRQFGSAIPGLPQDEPTFSVFQIDNQGFVKLFQTHRNIFIVEIQEEGKKPKVEIKRDNWSYPQLVIKVVVANENEFAQVMEKNGEDFIERYLAVERERTINAYQRMTNDIVRNKLKEQFKVNMSIPEGYFIGKESQDFIWIRRTGTRDDLEMGVMVSFFPYKDAVKDFDPNIIMSRRDSLTRAHIPGQFPNSFMTSYADIRPSSREINFKGNFAKELRGLWRVEGDFMGGPFVNYTLVDTANNRLVMLDGFVYAPKFEKRNYLRQIEAIIYSIEFL